MSKWKGETCINLQGKLATVAFASVKEEIRIAFPIFEYFLFLITPPHLNHMPNTWLVSPFALVSQIPYGLFILSDSDTNSDSDLDC